MNYRSKKIHNKEVSNIQKAYEINGESFATSNFIPAYLYHGTVGGSTAAIFKLIPAKIVQNILKIISSKIVL
ncbi:hypothetical protein FD50_GL000368 [Liquorilactobacillus satsumensis DSM 16230 = JCM 12392]|uniref:Uncharacterized protein n=1 Tax=Liquorilactobacillus satsumensis DSM 16230 = JCM 12392 TaxID=1423801 RepID=A0A0R1V7L9_9LACO|nr:hypothetical protein FD50_GL000368 [Liquorilactobacillus satsumensis DSM 16230 = JCM 12392]